jgi:hypothetical protein
MQAIASATAVRPQFAGAKKSFAAKKVRHAPRARRKTASRQCRVISPATKKSRVASPRASRRGD